MGLESGRHLWRAATVSLLFWLITWLLALAILPFSGARFWYLFLGIAEPLIFLVVLLAPERSSVWSLGILVLVVAQFIAHIVAVVLRCLLISRPFDVAQLLDLIFVVLEFFAAFIYIWYTMCAYRHFEQSRITAAGYQPLSTLYDPGSSSSSTAGTIYDTSPSLGKGGGVGGTSNSSFSFGDPVKRTPFATHID